MRHQIQLSFIFIAGRLVVRLLVRLGIVAGCISFTFLLGWSAAVCPLVVVWPSDFDVLVLEDLLNLRHDLYDSIVLVDRERDAFLSRKHLAIFLVEFSDAYEELITVIIPVHLRMRLRFGAASALLVLWRILYEIIAIIIDVLTRPLWHVDRNIISCQRK
ncbi:hypothetical protein KC345_g182 [Hortaea werneckii]|nr:hypothetical protein KC345_g182 [Hortaea werneckii]